MSPANQIAAAFIASHDAPMNAKEALLDVVNAYAGSLTGLQRAQLADSIERITTARPGWPIERAFEVPPSQMLSLEERN